LIEMTLELTLATFNPAKAVRLRSLCDGLPVRIRESGLTLPMVDESSATHLGNAIAKAIGWSRAVGGVTLASDGGLVIPALGDGWESTLTRRATGEDVTDAERARRLLARMRDVAGTLREAYWTEAIAVARDGVLVCAWETDGMLGRIGDEFRQDPVGPDGFWADGLWETPEGKKRWELTASERADGADPWAKLHEPVNSLLARMS
jgi:inosine/xanthosine triphosphate pyrophosphatase family protein